MEGKTYGIGTKHVCVMPTKKIFHELPPFHFHEKGILIPHRKRFFMASCKDIGFFHFYLTEIVPHQIAEKGRTQKERPLLPGFLRKLSFKKMPVQNY